MIRMLWVVLHLLVLTIPLGIVVILLALLRARRERIEWVTRLWARSILRASGTPVTVEGAEHIREDRPQIIAANHQSWYDIFALAVHLPKHYRFVAKKELEWIPIFGTAWKVAGHISIDRSDRTAAIRSLDRAGELMREDNSAVIIFPEGTRSLDGRMLPFKKGAFMLALHTGVEIVPTALIGTFQIHRKHGWRIRPGPIILRFGEPVSAARYAAQNRDELVDEVRSRIEGLMAGKPPGGARRAS